jgi:hypothetical protein
MTSKRPIETDCRNAGDPTGQGSRTSERRASRNVICHGLTLPLV